MHLRRDQRRDLRDALRGDAVIDGEHQDAGAFDADLLEHARTRCVARFDRHAAGALLADRGRVQLERDDPQPECGQRLDHRSPGRAIADHDGVVLQRVGDLGHATLAPAMTRHQPAAELVHQRGAGDRQHRDDQEDLVGAFGQHVGAAADLCQNKRELADLRQQQSRSHPDPAGLPQDPRRERDDRRLAGDDHDQSPEHGPRAVDDHRRIEQHADRDEEQAGERVAERLDLRHRVAMEVRVGEQNARQECAKRHGHAKTRGHDRHRQTERRQGEHEELATARAAHQFEHLG